MFEKRMLLRSPILTVFDQFRIGSERCFRRYRLIFDRLGSLSAVSMVFKTFR